MNKIDKDFVYNRFPKTENDIKLYEDYKAFISLKRKTEAKNDLEELLALFPVYEGTVYSLFTKGLKMQMMFSS